jgi:ADP-heptose:LPS heptosyltransferase/SAM-dependent methyltransferase
MATTTAARHRVLLEFRHGLGDAVQMTVLLKHLKHYHPNWEITAASLRGKHSAHIGHCAQVLILEEQTYDRTAFDQVIPLDWHECHADHEFHPSTKPAECLINVFGLGPRPDLFRYAIRIHPASQQLATDALAEYCPGDRPANGRHKTVIIHYQGNTSEDKKNLPHEIIKEVCEVIHNAGHVPVILDWDNRSTIVDNVRVFSPGPIHRLWNGHGIGDAIAIAALIEASTLMIGVDSGPLHVAGATTTPTLAVWTNHHPVHFFDLADNVTHFVPPSHHDLTAGRKATEYFRQNYRHHVYNKLNVDLPAMVQSILTGASFERLQNQRFLNTLRSTAYDENYYNEHRSAGLDYLNFGDWQRQYGRWLTDSLNWKSRRVLDVGSACGSILRGFGEAGTVVQGVEVNEFMVNLGRKKWPDMAKLLHVCDAVNLHLFADKSWDGIHSAQVAEHWKPNLVPHILRELHRVTVDNGLFFCALDTVELFERQNRKLETEDPTHVCIRPAAWWTDQLNAAGWTLVSDQYTPPLTEHPETFLTRYDWAWFVARKSHRPTETTTPYEG